MISISGKNWEELKSNKRLVEKIKIVKSMSFNHLNTKISFEILNSKNEFNILVKIKDNMWNNKSSRELEIIDLIQITNKP